MNRNYKKALLSLGLSGMMALSLVAPVFAAEDDAHAYITKQFDMPVGTTLPKNAKFAFNVSNAYKDGNEALTDLNDKEIAIDINDSKAYYTSKKTVEINGEGNDKKVDRYVAYTDLLTTKLQNSVGSSESTTTIASAMSGKPGTYTFTLKETQPSDKSNILSDGPTPKDVTIDGKTYKESVSTALTYSKAEYNVTVDVLNKKGSTADTYISSVRVYKVNDDNGDEIKDPNKQKVNPSKPDDNIPGSGGLRFVNTYTEKITYDHATDPTPDKPEPNPDPSDPTKPDWRDSTFSVGKLVSGNQSSDTQEFKFTVKVTQPSLVTTDETYTAHVYDKNGNPVKNKAASTDGNETIFGTNENGLVVDSNGKSKFPSGTKLNIKLKHGDKLVFDSNLNILLKLDLMWQ